MLCPDKVVDMDFAVFLEVQLPKGNIKTNKVLKDSLMFSPVSNRVQTLKSTPGQFKKTEHANKVTQPVKPEVTFKVSSSKLNSMIHSLLTKNDYKDVFKWIGALPGELCHSPEERLDNSSTCFYLGLKLQGCRDYT